MKSDLISRQAAIDMIMGQPQEPHYPSWYAEQIKALPSATPEREKGKWILQNNKKKPFYGWFICSVCDALIGEPTNFCSECGADMREVDDGQV